jgi:hypothetical protein
MSAENDFKRLFEELSTHESTVITLSTLPISVRVFDKGEKLALATAVYEGGNYIPQSVRRCLNKTTPLRPTSIKKFLNVDEGRYQISLNYLGQLDHLNDRRFRDLIEEFSFLAEEWRLFLDEHDKNDLVHVRVQ